MWLMSLSLYAYPYANIRGNQYFAIALDLTLCLIPLLYFVYLIIRYIRKEAKWMCTHSSLKDICCRKREQREGDEVVEGEERENRQYSFADRIANPKRYMFGFSNSVTTKTNKTAPPSPPINELTTSNKHILEESTLSI